MTGIKWRDTFFPFHCQSAFKGKFFSNIEYSDQKLTSLNCVFTNFICFFSCYFKSNGYKICNMEPYKVLEFTIWFFFTPLDIERYTVVNQFCNQRIFNAANCFHITDMYKLCQFCILFFTLYIYYNSRNIFIFMYFNKI